MLLLLLLFAHCCQRTHTYACIHMHMHAQRMPMRISFKGKYACKVFASGLWAMTLELTLHSPLSLSPYLPCYWQVFVHLDQIAIVGQVLHALLWLQISHVHIFEGLRHFLCASASDFCSSSSLPCFILLCCAMSQFTFYISSEIQRGARI